MLTTVTIKGQVTIPKPIRDQLGVAPGDRVDFALGTDGQIVLIKAGGERKPSRFAALRGIAGAGMSTDEIMALTRAE